MWGLGSPLQSDPGALLERGRKLYDAGQFSEAVTVLQQAASAFQARGDGLRQAIASSNLSLALKQLGQWEKALNQLTESVNLLQSRSIGNSKDRLKVLAQILDVRGNLQLELGKADQALETWKQAANTYDRVGDAVGKTRSTIEQSLAQQALGLYRQAKTNLEQLYPFEQPDSLLKASALRSLGNTLQSIGDLEQSLRVLQQSRDVAQRLQSPSEISATLLSLGNTERALGDTQTRQDTASEKTTPLRCINTNPNVESQAMSRHYRQAVRYYEEAASTASQPTQLQAQLNQLSVLLELKQWSEAQNLWPNLQLSLTEIPLSQTAVYARINLAQSLLCLKQATAANTPSLREIAKTLATAIQQAKSLGDKRSEAYALGALGGLYLNVETLPATSLRYAQGLTEQALTLAQGIGAADIAYLWQWQLGHILKTRGDFTGAIAAYTEAVSTLKSLRGDLAALNPNVQFSFRDNVEPVYRQLVDLLLQPSQERERSQQNLKSARDTIEALQLTELENFFREACLQAKLQQIDEVVDKTDRTAAVIYPIILPDRLEVILKLPNLKELRHYTTYKPQS